MMPSSCVAYPLILWGEYIFDINQLAKNHPLEDLMNRVILLISFSLLIFTLFAAGPGNVSSGLMMWLDANALSLSDNDPVSSWTDRSGNSKHAVQDTVGMQPLYKTNIINGKPAIVFDGTNDYLGFDGNIIVNTNYSIFTVVRRNATGPSNNFYIGGTNPTSNNNLHVGWRSNNTLTHDHYGNGYDLRVPSYSSGATASIYCYRHSSTEGKDVYINGGHRASNMNNAIISGTPTRRYPLQSYPGASLGRYFGSNFKSFFNGFMAEIIIYNRYVNETERRAIESYLANKYNISIGSVGGADHYTNMIEFSVTSAAPTNSRLTGGLTITGNWVSGGTGRIRGGHNNANGMGTSSNPDPITYPNFQRLNRQWFMEFTSSNITADFSFDLEILTPDINPAGDKYRLLYRSDTKDNFSVLALSPTVNGKIVSFTGASITAVSSSGFYTLGTLDGEESTLPVELSSFLGVITPSNNVRLEWITQSETAVQGYYLYRGTQNELSGAQLISPLIHAANNPGMTHYSWTDEELTELGTYWYWLQSLDLDGSFQFHGPISVVYSQGQSPTPEVPLVTGITSTYPNPFNPSVTIAYSLKEQGDAQLTIYNLKGQVVKEFSLPQAKSGAGSLIWDAANQPSGAYLLMFKAGNTIETKKITLSK